MSLFENISHILQFTNVYNFKKLILHTLNIINMELKYLTQ